MDLENEEKPVSVRESLQAAIKEQEEPGDQDDARLGETPPEEEQETPPEEKPEGEQETPPEEEEQETPSEGEAAPEKKLDQQGKPVQEGKKVEPPPPPVRAPAALSPAERVEFAKASPTIQKAIIRREAEISKTLNDTAEARKGWDEYRRTVAPYEQAIRSEGAEPMVAIGNLLRMSMAMRFAPVQQKVQLVANMVKQFLPRDEATVDLLAKHLEAVFTGKEAPGGMGGPQTVVDPRFDQFMGELQRRSQEREKTTQQEIAKRYEAFAENHEYFHDVKHVMGALIDAEASKGVVLSDEEAYERACSVHPEIAPIRAQQKAAEAATRPNKRVQQAKDAGSSVRAAPVGKRPDSGAQPTTVRGSIEASIKKLQAAQG